jgi:multicomponent Na+:H+ antiporter subunit D
MVRALNLEDRHKRQQFVGAAVIIDMLLTLFVLMSFRGQSCTFIRLAPGYSIVLSVDTMSVAFGSLVSILWVLTTFYAFTYMSHEGEEVRFFTFFTAAMGVSVGLALAANPLTFYLFYELLTFITLPLIVHNRGEESVHAGRKYLLYAVPAATLGLISTVFVSYSSAGAGYAYGGIMNLSEAALEPSGMLVIYFLGFTCFAVKSAVFPVHGWLPTAYVAPTPVTALLHAVAVVNAGLFGIIRLTYFTFNHEFLQGTWVQALGIALALITILYGAVMALRANHLKMRLAYSTIGHLSYILFAAMLLTPAGLRAGMIYMIVHSLAKITLFFCCGTIMFMTGKTDVREMDGYGKTMPDTFGCFFIASLGLLGVMPTVGFIGKWEVIASALASGSELYAYAGIGAIMISILLTVLYIMPLSIKAFFSQPAPETDLSAGKRAPAFMGVPVLLLAIAITVLGFFPGLVTGFVATIGAM